MALVQPGFAVSTAEAYAWLDASRGGYAPQPQMMGAERFASWEAVAPLTGNDFEPVITEHHAGLPGIAEALHRAGASIARMTGSGSTMYGIFALPPNAAALAKSVPGSVIVTSTVTSVQPVELVDVRA